MCFQPLPTQQKINLEHSATMSMPCLDPPGNVYLLLGYYRHSASLRREQPHNCKEWVWFQLQSGV